jgi:PIN domain nuclease of toxin-antitoxin system
MRDSGLVRIVLRIQDQINFTDVFQPGDGHAQDPVGLLALEARPAEIKHEPDKLASLWRRHCIALEVHPLRSGLHGNGHAKEAIDDEQNTLFLSDISVWEIAMKHAAGKLNLPQPPRRWVPTQTEFFQLRRVALQEEAIYLSGELPLAHRDPFDRLLAAQTQSLAMPVVTPDQPFSQLGASVIW